MFLPFSLQHKLPACRRYIGTVPRLCLRFLAKCTFRVVRIGIISDVMFRASFVESKALRSGRLAARFSPGATSSRRCQMAFQLLSDCPTSRLPELLLHILRIKNSGLRIIIRSRNRDLPANATLLLSRGLCSKQLILLTMRQESQQILVLNFSDFSCEEWSLFSQ